MGIISSEKIFIDPKEEINFIIERALRSEKEKLIFVVPQNSIILSSPVSINILYKEIAKTKKTALIVTEDGYGQTIAEKAGFVVSAKVSQITREDWDLALTRKLKYIDAQEKRKKQLLSDIGLIETEKNEPEVVDVVHKAEDVEIVEVPEVEPVAEVMEEEEVLEETPEEEVEEVGMFQRPRKESKVVELGALKIASGGDIRSFLNVNQGDKIQGNLNSASNMADVPDRKVKTVVGSSSFAGKDFTKHVQSDGGGGGFFDKLFGTKRSFADGSPEAALFRKKRRKKIIIIGTIVAIILLLGGGYLFAFQLSSVDLTVTFKQEDVSASANILLNPDVTEVSFDPAIIPAKVLREEGISSSKAGEATGTGKTGTKAQGFVTIYNLTDNAITLANGTKLTNPAGGKQYVLKQEVALDAGTPNTAYYADNIPIEAIDYGSEYNIPVSSDSTSLEVDGYSSEFASKKLYARVFNEVSGGASEEFIAVTQEDVDKLKEAMMPEVEAKGEAKIRIAIPSGYTLISESIEFTESEVSAIPAVGEEADDGNFTLSIEGYVEAYAVSNEDLKTVAQRVLSEGRETADDIEEGLDEGDVVVGDIDLPQITSIEESEEGIIITISTQASVGVRPSDETIKNSIAGKSMDEAQEYLDNVDSIDTYKLNFTPSFVPEAFRRVPSDTSRISIRVR